MDVDVLVAIVLALLFGAGMWLVLVESPKLSRRAKELNLWPDLVDVPDAPWAIYPEWSARLLWDTLVRSHQKDARYLELRGRVRLGTLLAIVALGGIMALGMHSKSTGPPRSSDATSNSNETSSHV